MNLQKTLRPYIGICVCAGSSLFFCICNVFVKHLKHVNPLIISCARLFIIAMISMPIAASRMEKEYENLKGNNLLMFVRAAIGSINLMIYFYALQVILFVYFYHTVENRGMFIGTI